MTEDMTNIKHISGYDEFLKIVTSFNDDSKQVNIYFTGAKTENGKSWCPDCNDAEPFVMQSLKEYGDKDSIFMVVDVGGREYWKDQKNDFRMDSNVRLSVIPTLVRWKTVQRLEGDQCAKGSLLEMFFTENSD